MHRREVLRRGAARGVATVAGCAAPSNAPTFQEGFEGGLGDWTSDAALGLSLPEAYFFPDTVSPTVVDDVAARVLG